MLYTAVKMLLWKGYLLKDALFKKRVYTELKNIAKSLEEEIFTKLRENGVAEASLEITESGLKIHRHIQAERGLEYEHVIPISPEAREFFKGLGISRMELDAILESNQIMDILRDVYALKHSSLLMDGYEAYCAITKFFPDSGLLSIKYHYCEMDYSKAVRGIKQGSKVKDHRVFFQKAPRYGIAVGLAVTALGLILPHLPGQLSIALSLMIGIAAGLITFIFFQVLGSLEYDKEYLEKRLKGDRK